VATPPPLPVAPTPPGMPPGIHRVAVPLVGNPLGSVNVYLIESPDGPILIDAAWQTPDALAAVEAGLAALGARVEDVSMIVLTHGHPDHTGLAAPLRERSGAPILLHRRDWPLVAPARRGTPEYFSRASAWFRRNGMPDLEQGQAGGARRAMTERNPPFVPDRALDDGDTLTLGAYICRVIWCPGHARGEVVLHDADRRLLIAGDHVLPHISPNVGIYRDDDGDPLGDYIASLARVRDLPADHVLPGHGDPFATLAARADALLAHHQERLAEILVLLAAAPATAFDLAARLPWSGGRRTLADLHPFQQSMALAETIAHLEVLRTRAHAAPDDRDDRLWWRAT